MLLGLGRGHTGLQQSDHVLCPITRRALESFSLREALGYPKLAAVQLTKKQREVEFAWHHADDLVGLASRRIFRPSMWISPWKRLRHVW
jgi:hypothetical protein